MPAAAAAEVCSVYGARLCTAEEVAARYPKAAAAAAGGVATVAVGPSAGAPACASSARPIAGAVANATQWRATCLAPGEQAHAACCATASLKRDPCVSVLALDVGQSLALGHRFLATPREDEVCMWALRCKAGLHGANGRVRVQAKINSTAQHQYLQARQALLRSWATFQAPSRTRRSHSAC